MDADSYQNDLRFPDSGESSEAASNDLRNDANMTRSDIFVGID